LGREWRTVARTRPFAGLLRLRSVGEAEGQGGKRCAARTATGKPCAAWPLQGTAYCPLHTPGRAEAMGRKGGSAGRGSRAWRERGALVSGEGRGHGDPAHHISDEGRTGGAGGGNEFARRASVEAPAAEALGRPKEIPTPSEISVPGEDVYVDPLGNRIPLPYGRDEHGQPRLQHTMCSRLPFVVSDEPSAVAWRYDE
jgi:hypothetical protein